MLRKIIGYILIGMGFLGVAYFRSYHGSLIPIPFFWFLLSIAIIVIGLLFTYNARIKKETAIINDETNKIKALKEKGEKVVLDIDSCDFKTNDYQEVIESKSSTKVQMYDGLYDENYHYSTQERNQNVIIYNYKNEKFISQVFSIDNVTLKFHIINNSAVLYIDRFDRSNYYFELDL